MKKRNLVVSLILALNSICLADAMAQGIEGAPPTSPTITGGTSAGGPLLPGKTDDERWRFFQSQERFLIGKSSSQIIKMLGKGGAVKGEDDLIYQITLKKKRPEGKTPSVAYTELYLRIVRNVVTEYRVRAVWH